ncbi:WSC-domain-containing protein, partial [Exidia glandulosa HHB12029]
MLQLLLLFVAVYATVASAAVLNTTQLTARAPIVFPSGWQTLIPCAVDTPDRVLRSVVIKQLSDNTVSRCMALCDSLGYNYAGLEYSNECHCGRGVVKGAGQVASSECNMACAGDETQSCGGSWRMQLYYTQSTVSKNPTIPSGWAVSAACAVDVGDRVLKDDYFITLEKNTPALCMTTCGAKGYSYAGVEYTNECHCGSGLAGSLQSVDASECYMNCAGDSTLDCGGPWRIQVYKASPGASGYTPTPTTTASSTTTTSTSISTTTTSTSTSTSRPATTTTTTTSSSSSSSSSSTSRSSTSSTTST